jgi:hypothetical protein
VSSGTDSFTKVNEEIAKYIARTIPGAGDFRTAMINLSMDPLVEPVFLANPAAANHAEMLKIWRRTESFLLNGRKNDEESQAKSSQSFWDNVTPPCEQESKPMPTGQTSTIRAMSFVYYS